MANAIEVVHEDGRRTRMSPTWLAKVGASQGWRPVDEDQAAPPAAKPKATRARNTAAPQQDVPTTVEDGPSTSEEE